MMLLRSPHMPSSIESGATRTSVCTFYPLSEPSLRELILTYYLTSIKGLIFWFHPTVRSLNLKWKPIQTRTVKKSLVFGRQSYQRHRQWHEEMTLFQNQRNREEKLTTYQFSEIIKYMANPLHSTLYIYMNEGWEVRTASTKPDDYVIRLDKSYLPS